MKKEVKEKAFLNSYVNIIQEIPVECFEHAHIGPAMLLAFKGARKKILEGGTLWRKYETELIEERKFALKFPGVGNLSRLPCRTAQLQQMKRPLIIKLWKEKYPAESGINYDDDISVWGNIQISASRFHVVTHHQVKQEVMKDTSCDKYLFAFFYVAMFEAADSFICSR